MDLDTFETVVVFTVVASDYLVFLWDGGTDVAGVH
jgi:hypothetical protein